VPSTVGGLGAGHAMKCLNNLITSVNLLALSEGLAMGKRYGLDPAAMVDVLDAVRFAGFTDTTVGGTVSPVVKLNETGVPI